MLNLKMVDLLLFQVKLNTSEMPIAATRLWMGKKRHLELSQQFRNPPSHYDAKAAL